MGNIAHVNFVKRGIHQLNFSLIWQLLAIYNHIVIIIIGETPPSIFFLYLIHVNIVVFGLFLFCSSITRTNPMAKDNPHLILMDGQSTLL